jgi:hypothetical protein
MIIRTGLKPERSKPKLEPSAAKFANWKARIGAIPVPKSLFGNVLHNTAICIGYHLEPHEWSISVG